MMEESRSEDFVQDEDQQELFEHHRLKVDAGQSPVRIDKYLSDKIAAVSRNKIQQAADEAIDPREWRIGEIELQGAAER